ncbi:hypothetical protein HHI36_004244 [Cryptolaemus montrouzieri]|uniref:Major facilitator superfamily (MFS) profile domain-containing protein n=1 Tax=Cryptolaemus montrouzieri TaxID=559131 RepID=A0ABD2NQV5_9CUCU
MFIMLELLTETEVIQYVAVAFGSLNMITCGLFYGWPSASLPHLENFNDASVNLHLSPDEGSWVAVATLLGSMIGCPLAGLTVDIMGRKEMILFSCIPYIASLMTIAFATTPGVLIIGRFIAGISDGLINTTLPIYIGEIASPKIRGMLGSSTPICLILGILIINIMTAFFSVSNAALLSTIFPITCFAGMFFMPKSPYFLLTKNRNSEAKEALKKLRGTEEIDAELKEMTMGVESAREESKENFTDFLTISSNKRAFLIAILIKTAQQLTGITPLIFYASLILEEADIGKSVTICTIIFFLAQLIMSLIGSAIVDWCGRRVLLIWSAIGSAVALFIEGIYFQLKSEGLNLDNWHIIPVSALIIFVFFYGFGLQNIPYLILGELFSTNIKAAAVCYIGLYFALLSTAISQFFQIISTTWGTYLAFYIFTVCSIVSSILMYMFVPETNGITLAEIQTLLSAGRKYGDDEKPIK